MKYCLGTNICQFRNQTYVYPDGIGVPIGSPLGSTLAEMFMCKFEGEFFESQPEIRKHIIYWHRYVDDIIILWDGPTEVFQHLLNSLNGRYPTIEFTAEFGGKEIGFLDLKISFGIHRKSSNTDIIINNSSYRPTVHKMAAFYSLIHRRGVTKRGFDHPPPC